MRRSAWQSKNLPRGVDTPWKIHYITPIYAESIGRDSKGLRNQFINRGWIDVDFPFTTIPLSHSRSIANLVLSALRKSN